MRTNRNRETVVESHANMSQPRRPGVVSDRRQQAVWHVAVVGGGPTGVGDGGPASAGSDPGPRRVALPRSIRGDPSIRTQPRLDSTEINRLYSSNQTQ
jgi:hypothetical protein